MPTKYLRERKKREGQKNIQAWITPAVYSELKILCQLRGWFLQDAIAEAVVRFLRQELRAMRKEGRAGAEHEQDLQVGFRAHVRVKKRNQ